MKFTEHEINEMAGLVATKIHGNFSDLSGTAEKKYYMTFNVCCNAIDTDQEFESAEDTELLMLNAVNK